MYVKLICACFKFEKNIGCVETNCLLGCIPIPQRTPGPIEQNFPIDVFEKLLSFANQKYRCLACKHQFAPDTLPRSRGKKYHPCPMCGKSSFLHHDYRDYSNFRCSDKKCNHSFFQPKSTAALPPSVSKLFGKSDLSRMRYPVHLIITVLTLFFIGKSSTRNISLMLYQLYNIKISHVTVAAWFKKFAPLFDNISLKLIPTMNFNSDEWHADETVVKIAGKKYYFWFIIDSETRFVLGFHLSPHRSSPQAHALFQHVSPLGNSNAIVSDRYSAYNIPTKCYFPHAKHIRVESFKDDISNNLIEAFNRFNPQTLESCLNILQ